VNSTTAVRGQSPVEFALIAPVFFALVFATIDIGRAIVTFNVISNAARDGARYATVAAVTSTGGCATVTDSAISGPALRSAGPFANSITVHATQVCAQDSASSPFYPTHFYVVNCSIPFQPFTSAVAGFGPITLNAQSKMYIYQP
jgi:Flp pilus assembly protein TadG